WDQCSPEVQAELVFFDRFVTRGGESVSELRSRILAFTDTLSGGKHLLFTHGGVIRVLLRLMGRDHPVPPGGLMRLVRIESSPGPVEPFQLELHTPRGGH
ncbi:MAG: histidine phosphatase family protein, partial [Actinobacteria bacterium]|nr:histidine phosphatase family protein [Actinomycetota bacterium]